MLVDGLNLVVKGENDFCDLRQTCIPRPEDTWVSNACDVCVGEVRDQILAMKTYTHAYSVFAAVKLVFDSRFKALDHYAINIGARVPDNAGKKLCDRWIQSNCRA